MTSAEREAANAAIAHKAVIARVIQRIRKRRIESGRPTRQYPADPAENAYANEDDDHEDDGRAYTFGHTNNNNNAHRSGAGKAQPAAARKPGVLGAQSLLVQMDALLKRLGALRMVQPAREWRAAATLSGAARRRS